jgi:hypothetical protein
MFWPVMVVGVLVSGDLQRDELFGTDISWLTSREEPVELVRIDAPKCHCWSKISVQR